MNPNEVHVLVVDDVPDAAQSLATLLELHGYTVQTANSGEEALRLVAEAPPLCVILDIDMPGRVDGLELSKQLRALHGTHIVLIAVTGWPEEDPRVAETFEIVDHYLQKPVNPVVFGKLLPPV